MVSAALDRVQVALDAHGCTRQGHDWQCPSHDDRRASLSVKATDDGAVLIHCHAGCTAEQVCSALGLKMCDLFAGPPSINGHRRIVAIYDYVDEAGKLLYQVARFTPKGFAQRRPDGKGGCDLEARPDPARALPPAAGARGREQRQAYLDHGGREGCSRR